LENFQNVTINISKLNNTINNDGKDDDDNICQKLKNDLQKNEPPMNSQAGILPTIQRIDSIENLIKLILTADSQLSKTIENIEYLFASADQIIKIGESENLIDTDVSNLFMQMKEYVNVKSVNVNSKN